MAKYVLLRFDNDEDADDLLRDMREYPGEPILTPVQENTATATVSGVYVEAGQRGSRIRWAKVAELDWAGFVEDVRLFRVLWMTCADPVPQWEVWTELPVRITNLPSPRTFEEAQACAEDMLSNFARWIGPMFIDATEETAR